MRPFTFNPGPRLLAGADQAQALAEKLPEGPCLFVTDRDLVRLGIAESYRSGLAATREVTVFDEVEADPSKETLLAAVEAGRSVGAASVVGLGGGSPMDVAKLAAYLLGSGDILDEIWGVGHRAGAAAAACPCPDDGRDRVRSDTYIGHHVRRRGEAGRELVAADCGLGGTRCWPHSGASGACNRSDGDRCDRACCRGLHLGAAQESSV